MGNKAIDFFYKNVIESSLDEDSNGEIELLFTTASMMHEHYVLPQRRCGSSEKRKANTDRDR
jgi:hypothetical protein